MQHLLRLTWSDFNKDNKNLRLLLTPSWISGTLVVTAAMILITATVFATQFPGSGAWQLLQLQAVDQPTISNNYQAVDQKLSLNTFVNNFPLMIFWGVVGFMCYSVTISLINIFRGAVNFKETLDYVNVDRHRLIADVLIKLVVRIAILFLWLAYINLSINIFLPFSIAATQYASNSGLSPDLVYALLAFVVLVICLHIHTIFLRLIKLRPRLFGTIS